MLVQHYCHRIPADYPMAKIRARAAARGPLWETMPGLGFKAFAIRERGVHGVAGNAYASFYLWLDVEAVARFLTDDRFAGVIATFGRPRVATLVPLVSLAGAEPEDARVLTRSEVAIGPAEELGAVHAREVERAEATVERSGVAAVVVALDPSSWRLTRLVLSRDREDTPDAMTFEIAYFARPGWAQIPSRSLPCP